MQPFVLLAFRPLMRQIAEDDIAHDCGTVYKRFQPRAFEPQEAGRLEPCRSLSKSSRAAELFGTLSW
jgi:hypothetical protein